MAERRENKDIQQEEEQYVGKQIDAAFNELTGEGTSSAYVDGSEGGEKPVEELSDQELARRYREAAENAPSSEYATLKMEMSKRFEMFVSGRYEIDRQDGQEQRGDE